MLSKDESRGVSTSFVSAKTLHGPCDAFDSLDTDVLAGVIDVLEPGVGPLGERRSLRGFPTGSTPTKQESKSRVTAHQKEAKSSRASSNAPAGGVSKPSTSAQEGMQTAAAHQMNGQGKGSRPKNASGAEDGGESVRTHVVADAWQNEAEHDSKLPAGCDRTTKSFKKSLTVKKSLFADLDISLSRDYQSGGSGVFLNLKV